MARNYSNTAGATTLENVGGITPTSTQIILGNTNGYPSQFPFTLRLDPNTASEELVTVNSGGGSAGNPYVVSRGADGTTAKSHAQFSVITHGFSARDLREPQVHMDDDFRHARRPLYTNQVSDPPLNVTTVFVNFTSAAWPPITFTAPASGRIRVTISAALYNANTPTSTIWASYRITGGISLEGSEAQGLSASGTRLYASRSSIIDGITAGVSTTVTPTWNLSSGNGSTGYVTRGQLTVELLP